jgi:hypothetical protein
MPDQQSTKRHHSLQHGHTRGHSESHTYQTWRAMKARCSYTTALDYQYYGGRGIRVCERWRESFPAFLEDMGARPSKEFSIDRIDVNGDYEPGNCRWATRSEQTLNRRRVKPLRSHCKRGHEYTAESTGIRGRNRYCIPCNRLVCKQRYQRLQEEKAGTSHA